MRKYNNFIVDCCILQSCLLKEEVVALYTGLAKKNCTLGQSVITFFGMRYHFKIFTISLRQYIA